eukprot:TRINITY_DN1513_c5_g1_i1.p1 TRINITY_DN1513_c5_g1~~TRINITY_DN1513_c5_g1_i1.p1  ORF type:complete len:447 (+),score=93.78 TRINITY_DN1513_c5_g1_i1:155-1342(+)
MEEAIAVLRHALGPSSEGNDAGCSSDQKVPMSAPRRALLVRLIQLLLQEDRAAEAIPLLRLGGYRYRLSSWVMRYPSFAELQAQGACPLAADLSLPLRVFDEALPESFCQHLSALLVQGSAFWKEHGYSEVAGSGENGYFSYLHSLEGEPKSTIDVIAKYLLKFLQPHFPELERATCAEWWAHCRPHACGHQMHFDSDNEGIGGATHPIATCIVYVEAPDGFGGPTLITDQTLAEKTLATKGWLVFPKTGRLAAYTGDYLHGVVPGWGKSPMPECDASGASAAAKPRRRITWMIAFWQEIQMRPWGPDGLAGSSRPLPEPAEDFVIGPKRYTWHRKFALPAPGFTGEEFPLESAAPVPVPLRQGVWTSVEGVDTPHGSAVTTPTQAPPIDECWQF